MSLHFTESFLWKSDSFYAERERMAGCGRWLLSSAPNRACGFARLRQAPPVIAAGYEVPMEVQAVKSERIEVVTREYTSSSYEKSMFFIFHVVIPGK